jgi:hypothetical protein
MAAIGFAELLMIGSGSLIGAAIFAVLFLLMRRSAPRVEDFEPIPSSASVLSIPPYSPRMILRRASTPRLAVMPVARPAFAYGYSGYRFQAPYGFQEPLPSPYLGADETGPASTVTVAAMAAELS